MGHIPVYAVTDTQGNGQAIQVGGSGEADTAAAAALYFFLSPIVAEAFQRKIMGSPTATTNAKELTVAGLFLGKIWFDILQQQQPQNDKAGVEYRLVPDPRDWLAAQMMMDGQGQEEEEEDQVPSLQVSSLLKPYNQIPLFSVNNNIQPNPNFKTGEGNVDFLNQLVSSHYMHFSSTNLMDGMEQQQEEEITSPPEELLFLHDIVSDMMTQHQSSNANATTTLTDYRNVVLMPPAPILEGTVSDKVLAQQLQDPNSFVYQNFFQPLLH
jgi:hypothetical protein